MKTVNLSPKTMIEAQIGFTWGILAGAFLGWMAILFFTPMAWYFKLFTSIGSLGICGSLLLSLNELIKARRSLLAAMSVMNGINSNNNNGGKTGKTVSYAG